MGNSGTAGRFLFHSRPRLLLFGAAHSNWYLVCYLILIDIAVFPCESEFLFTGQRDWVYRVRAKGPAIMTKDLRPWEWSLLALVVLLTAAGFTAYGVRATMSPWVIFGFVYAILNLGLLVVTLLVPSHAEEELRYTLRSFCFTGQTAAAAVLLPHSSRRTSPSTHTQCASTLPAPAPARWITYRHSPTTKLHSLETPQTLLLHRSHRARMSCPLLIKLLRTFSTPLLLTLPGESEHPQE